MAKFVPLHERPEDQALAIYIVEQHGVKATDIILDSITEEGYETVARDEDGRALLDIDGFSDTRFSAWPLGFPVQQFLALVWGRPVDMT